MTYDAGYPCCPLPEKYERELAAARAEAQRLREDATRWCNEAGIQEAENARLRSELETAHDESDKWFAIAAAEQDVKALLERNVKLREWLESSDGMMANYERLASKYHTERDALQAENARLRSELEGTQAVARAGIRVNEDYQARHAQAVAALEGALDGEADPIDAIRRALALLRGTEADK